MSMLAETRIYVWCIMIQWLHVSKTCGSVKKHVYTQIWSNLPTSVSFNIMEGMTYYIYKYIYILWYIIMI